MKYLKRLVSRGSFPKDFRLAAQRSTTTVENHGTNILDPECCSWLTIPSIVETLSVEDLHRIVNLPLDRSFTNSNLTIIS